MALMFTFLPSAFAYAAPVAAAESDVVAAEESTGGGDLDLSWLGDFWELITGLFDQIGGETIIETIKTFFANFLQVVSIGEFFDSVKKIWEDVNE